MTPEAKNALVRQSLEVQNSAAHAWRHFDHMKPDDGDRAELSRLASAVTQLAALVRQVIDALPESPTPKPFVSIPEEYDFRTYE